MLISREPNFGLSNVFFLLKTEIHTLVLNTQTFLSNFWGLRYLRNKMGFLIRWFWSKLKLFDLELPQILKTIEIKLVITSIQLVWVTRPTRSNLGAIRAHFGPVCRAWHKFCSFEATMRWYDMNRNLSLHHFLHDQVLEKLLLQQTENILWNIL